MPVGQAIEEPSVVTAGAPKRTAKGMCVTPIWDAYGWPARATHDAALFEGPQSVSLTFSKPILFVPRHLAHEPGAPLWFRRRRFCTLVYSLRSGRLQVYLDRTRRPGRRSAIYNVSTRPTLLLTVLEEHVRGVGGGDHPAAATAEMVAGRVVAKSVAAGAIEPPTDAPPLLRLGAVIYPLLLHSLAPAVRWPEVLPSAITPVLRLGTAREAAMKAFGSKATRPVIAATARSLCIREPRISGGYDTPWVNFVPLGLAVVAKPLLEPDQLVRILEAPSVLAADVERLNRGVVRPLRTLLAELSMTRRMQLLMQASATDHGVMALTDTANMLESLGGGWLPRARPRDLFELHDLVAAGFATMSSTDHPLTMFPKELVALHGKEIGADLRFVVPQSVGELQAWGRTMNNCIASYASAAYAGRTWLLGVSDVNGLRYNIEIHPGTGLRQFFSPYNTEPTEEDRPVVMAALRDAGLLSGRIAPRRGPELPAERQRCGWVDEEPF